MYQALYRKWRPMCFDDVIGQSHVTKTLKAQSAAGRLSHAYLFCGPRGTGKTTCARILAKAANCTHLKNGDPCNACPACTGINDGSITDVIEMDAATYTGVDDIRALRDEALYSPSLISRKVYIIDEIHMLSTNAFNAFLKILEEPPAHVMFVLASTEIQKIPATILSRCQRFEFKRIGRLDIIKKLMEIARAERIPLEESGASLIAHMADGAMRNALSLLEQAASQNAQRLDGDSVAASLGLAGAGALLEICGAISSGNSALALERFTELYASGVEPAAFCDQLLCLMRDIMVLRENGDFAMLGNGYTKDDLKAFFNTIPRVRALAAVKTLRDTLSDMGRSPNKRIDMEMCLISLCRPGNGGGGTASPAPEAGAPAQNSAVGAGNAAAADRNPAGGNKPAGAQKTPEVNSTDNDLKPAEEIKYRDELIATLRETIDMVTLSHLKLCSFLGSGDKIRIRTGDPMTYSIVSRKTVLEEVAAAAGRITSKKLCAAAEKTEAGGETVPDGLGELIRFAAENPDIAQLK